MKSTWSVPSALCFVLCEVSDGTLRNAGTDRLHTAGTGAKMLTLKGVSIASTCTSAARASAMTPYVLCRSRRLRREKTYGVSSSFFSGFVVR